MAGFGRGRQNDMLGNYGNRRLGLRDLWILFAQVVTVLLAILFVFAFINPRLGDGLHDLSSSSGVSLRHSLDRIIPSVVSIHTELEGKVNESGIGKQVNLGSGVIVSEEGFVITNHHVVYEAGNISVITDVGERFQAEVVGADPDIDIAVLRLDTDEFLPAANFQSKSNPLQVGDMVMSVGSPYGLASTASLGIVSATGRTNLGLSKYEYFIQTDAAINHGSSGGALANIHGELVGINTALFSKQFEGNFAQGIGFAIPAELAKIAYDEIVRYGRFRRGWIGLDLRNLPKGDLRRGRLDALQVSAVVGGSPGEEAGMQPGDLVLEIDGRPPSTISYLEEATGKLLRPGQDIEMQVMRDGDEFTVTVSVIER